MIFNIVAFFYILYMPVPVVKSTDQQAGESEFEGSMPAFY